jgi:endonuclease/exonuclease/phosphatase family metal-dependent hydrolase
LGVFMAGRVCCGLRRWVAVGALLACATALLTGSPAGGSAVPQSLRVLQLNLCDSGISRCYTGRSVAGAAAIIRAHAPDVVTLNEVCQGDVTALERTLARTGRGGTVGSAFQAAADRRTGGPFRCLNGQPYGIGVLLRLPVPGSGYTTRAGIYPVQDTRDPEERTWLCVRAAGFDACTTHLASTSPAIALQQCAYLLGTALPAVRAQVGYLPTVVGGDLNLRRGGTPDVRACAPPSYPRADDGSVQHILATPQLRLGSTRTVGLGTATDHPGLLVVLTGQRLEPAAGNPGR